MTTCSAHIRYSDKCPNCRDMANNEYTAQVERDRNALAVSHAELVAALEGLLDQMDGFWRVVAAEHAASDDTGIALERAVAAYYKARDLVPEKPTCS
ncbi:hypothetical protein LCGC14_0789870 [marine sediment metagenome]|uniref:Uncharacterized protein n=1 Tax=marine sediment metagenome TaxID=412755 RepID=A0A0F9QCQ6_9ZZZZ